MGLSPDVPLVGDENLSTWMIVVIEALKCPKKVLLLPHLKHQGAERRYPHSS